MTACPAAGDQSELLSTESSTREADSPVARRQPRRIPSSTSAASPQRTRVLLLLPLHAHSLFTIPMHGEGFFPFFSGGGGVTVEQLEREEFIP